MTKVNLIKDQIHINKKPITNFFEENPLPVLTLLILPYNQMTHSKEISQNDSHFRGHIIKVESLDQATAARNSMFQNFTNEHHITYAYSIKLDDEEVMTGNSAIK